jgi:hypothetical protein
MTNSFSLNTQEEEEIISNIQSRINNQAALLSNVDKKNDIIFQKQALQMELLIDIENKEKLLLTRSRMLQISQDRNSYKKKLIYTSFISIIILSIIFIAIYIIIISKHKPNIK